MRLKKNINVVKLFDLTPNSLNFNKRRCMTQRRENRYCNLEIEIERVFVLIRRSTPCLSPYLYKKRLNVSFYKPSWLQGPERFDGKFFALKTNCLLFCFRRFFSRHTRWYPSGWKKANGLENLSNGLQGRLFRQVIIHMINNFHYWKIHSTSTSVLTFFETFVLILKVEHTSEFRLWQGLQWTNLLVQNPARLCFSAEFCREKIMNARQRIAFFQHVM